jgi:hypothetical protein
MFRGSDYALYETLMRPYATRLSKDLRPEDIRSGWIPYYPSGVELDPIRCIVRDLDPIWPHQRRCDGREWKVCRHIDGVRSVTGIAHALRAARIDDEELQTFLLRLSVEGFVLFHAPSLQKAS